MPYIKETCKCGKVIEINKYFSSRYHKKGVSRGKNRAPTTEAQEKVNERQAIKELSRILNENYQENDIHLVLTYRKENRVNPFQGKENVDKLIRKLRKVYRALGEEFKWVEVTEYKNRVIHHHLIINYIDMRIINKLWKFGRARPTYLDESGDYSKLAEYLIKETSKTFKLKSVPFGKRYRRSRNLAIPEPVKEIVRADSWREDPKPLKGYLVLKNSLITGYHEITGYMFQSYSMVRIE